MSQYKVTTANLTNGSANVTIAGNVTAQIDAGDIMIRVGEGIPYFVAAAPTYTPPDTTVVLTGNYAGTSGNEAVTFERDFLALDGEGLPLLSNGDLETPTIFTRAMSVVQSVIEGLIAGTRAFTNILISGGSANFATLTQDSINVVEAGMVGNLTTSPLLDLNLASAHTAQQSLGGREFCYLCESDATHIDPYGVLQKSLFYSGTPTATDSISITDTGKSWTLNALAENDPYVICLSDGSNATYRWVRSNSATQVFWAEPVSFIPTSYKISLPRFEGNGLLMEGTSTNLVAYSEQFDNAAWEKVGLTVVADAAQAPDASYTADKIVPNTGVNFNRLRQSPIPLTVDTKYTLSVLAKAGEYSRITIFLDSTTAAAEGPYFGSAYVADLNDGTTNNTNLKTKAIGNGWYRVYLTFTAADVTAKFVIVALGPTDISVNDVTGDGSAGLYVWGAQFEALPFPSSYIPTTSGAVARAASRCSVPYVGNVPSPTAAMSLITAFDVVGFGTVVQRPIWIYGETNRGIQVNNVAGTVTAHHAGVGPHTLGTITPNVMKRYGWTWNGTTLQGWVNGTKAPSSQTTNPISGAASALAIGEDGGGNCFLNGHIRSIAIFSRVNSDAEMRIYS